MTRPRRISYPGALYHISSHSPDARSIFLDDQDRHRFLDMLAEVCQRFHWRVYSYCLLDDHYHLVVETKEANLSRGMRQLNGSYTQSFNRHHGRAGHIFQGRFKAILVEKDRYLLEVCRHVVLNPVRLRLVNHPGRWPWSSFRAAVGKAGTPLWLENNWLLHQFARNRRRAQEKFDEFVQAGGTAVDLWKDLRRQIYLGSESFIKRILSRRTVLGLPRSSLREPATKNPKRALAGFAMRYPDEREAMARAYLSGDFTLKAIADYYGVHYSTVSRAVRSFEKKSAST